MSRPVTVFVGLGGNVGDAKHTIAQAITNLDQLSDGEVVAVSSMYRSAPWGVPEQPDFINAVAMLSTRISPTYLLEALLAIERTHGRERDRETHWGPRTLDLDILLYGQMRIEQPGLCVPHPRMHERAFVLVPLLEIAPDAEIPGIGLARDCLSNVDTSDLMRLD